MSEKIRKMCPKEYAWFIADCDQGQDCEHCDLPIALITDGDISNEAKDVIHELIKIYSSDDIIKTRCSDCKWYDRHAELIERGCDNCSLKNTGDCYEPDGCMFFEPQSSR